MVVWCGSLPHSPATPGNFLWTCHYLVVEVVVLVAAVVVLVLVSVIKAVLVTVVVAAVVLISVVTVAVLVAVVVAVPAVVEVGYYAKINHGTAILSLVVDPVAAVDLVAVAVNLKAV